jgi:hypothetical protein
MFSGASTSEMPSARQALRPSLRSIKACSQSSSTIE